MRRTLNETLQARLAASRSVAVAAEELLEASRISDHERGFFARMKELSERMAQPDPKPTAGPTTSTDEAEESESASWQLGDVLSPEEMKGDDTPEKPGLYRRTVRAMGLRYKQRTADQLFDGPKNRGELLASCSLDWLIREFNEENQDLLPRGILPVAIYLFLSDDENPEWARCAELVRQLGGPDGQVPKPKALLARLEHEYPTFAQRVNRLLEEYDRNRPPDADPVTPPPPDPEPTETENAEEELFVAGGDEIPIEGDAAKVALYREWIASAIALDPDDPANNPPRSDLITPGCASLIIRAVNAAGIEEGRQQQWVREQAMALAIDQTGKVMHYLQSVKGKTLVDMDDREHFAPVWETAVELVANVTRWGGPAEKFIDTVIARGEMASAFVV